jgi:ribulose-5-phosphate 4-epimerase/fuculose-1-phosphate aldolase
MSDAALRIALAECGRSLFARGYSCGTSGNISVRLADGGFLMSPTNVSLGALDPDALSRLDAAGHHIGGAAPTKEAWLHMAMYRARPDDRAVVHLHSTHAVALSCRSDLDPADMLPAITPYAVMRVGRVACASYFRPGDNGTAGEIEDLARDCRALLLANHGPIVSGAGLQDAMSAAEELEETARLFFLLEGRPHRLLTAEQVQELKGPAKDPGGCECSS